MHRYFSRRVDEREKRNTSNFLLKRFVFWPRRDRHCHTFRPSYRSLNFSRSLLGRLMYFVSFYFFFSFLFWIWFCLYFLWERKKERGKKIHFVKLFFLNMLWWKKYLHVGHLGIVLSIRMQCCLLNFGFVGLAFQDSNTVSQGFNVCIGNRK